LPEQKYVHLPEVFSAGEIIIYKGFRGVCGETAFGVICQADPSDKVPVIADYSDIGVTVRCCDAESGEVFHMHWSLWNVERYRGGMSRKPCKRNNRDKK
jgi:hypothetical protein